jgi:DNA ligase-1
MLAREYDDLNKSRVQYPCYVQPKLDGVRMLVTAAKSKSTTSKYRYKLSSRNKKSFDHLLPVFEDALAGIFERLDDGVKGLDGELYVHGVPFQQLLSVVKTLNDERNNIEYHVYDCVTDGEHTFAERYALLKHAFSKNKSSSPVKLVNTVKVYGENEVKMSLSNAEHHGYEGLMIRSASGCYEMGKRSWNLLKYKRFKTDEFKVVGFKEANGRDKGTPVFELETTDKKRFHARPVGSLEDRRQMYKDIGSYVGKKMTVKYQGLTEGGVPRFPVALALRDYE